MAKTKKQTEPWYYRYLRREISKIWSWSPARKAAKKRAQTGKNPETFQCKLCGNPNLGKGEYEIDHITCKESTTGWDGWDAYIERAIGVTVDGLQLLCHACHDAKSAIENKARRDFKKESL